MKAAGLHLLGLGHRLIGLISGAAVRPALERRFGLEDAFAAFGLPPTYTADEGVFSVEHGAAAMRRLLDRPEPPTAIIAGGNQLMLGALRVVSERGLTLGRDLSFVGCDDVAVTDLFQPPVAVLRRDNNAMGGRRRSCSSPGSGTTPRRPTSSFRRSSSPGRAALRRRRRPHGRRAYDRGRSFPASYNGRAPATATVTGRHSVMYSTARSVEPSTACSGGRYAIST